MSIQAETRTTAAAAAEATWGPFSLRGRNALITGAAMGIGFGIAQRFVEAGANVVVADLDGVAARDAATRLAEQGRALSVAVDVSDAGAMEGAVDLCVRELGSLDILVNDAGIFPTSPVLSMSPEFFDRVIAVNLRGLVFASKAAGRRMVAQGSGGRIINIASIDAVHPSMTGLAAYDASKGGVLMFTRSFALEMAPHSVTVNAIAPGGITTEGASRPMAGLSAEAAEQVTGEFLRHIPLGRMGMPDDIALPAVFLASDAAAYVTGALLVVDGGRLLG